MPKEHHTWYTVYEWCVHLSSFMGSPTVLLLPNRSSGASLRVGDTAIGFRLAAFAAIMAARSGASGGGGEEGGEGRTEIDTCTCVHVYMYMSLVMTMAVILPYLVTRGIACSILKKPMARNRDTFSWHVHFSHESTCQVGTRDGCHDACTYNSVTS